MKATGIPQSFWHALTVTILTATGVVSYIALKATSVSIEIADMRIELLQVASDTESLARELELARKQLVEKEAELKRIAKDLARGDPNIGLPAFRDTDIPESIPEQKFEHIQERIKGVRSKIVPVTKG